MILFLIQIHEQHPNLAYLLSQIYRVEHVYVINIDAACSMEINIAALPQNVAVRRGAAVTWAGYSQTVEIVEALKFAATRFEGWTYVTNLSAVDVAVRPVEELRDFLRSARADAFLSYYGATDRRPYDFSPIVVLDHQDATLCSFRLEDRVTIRSSSSVRDLFLSRVCNPVMNYRFRPLFHCYDVQGFKEFVLRAPSYWERQERQEFIAEFGQAAGRSWYVLSRRAVDALLSDYLLPKILGAVEAMICSDELLLQTWIANRHEHHKLVVSNDNLRHKLGAPEYLSDHLLTESETFSGFFARKIIFDKSLQLRSNLSSYMKPTLTEEKFCSVFLFNRDA